MSFQTELKTNIITRNKQQIAKFLQISQVSPQDQVEEHFLYKDFLLNILKPKFNNFYISQNIHNRLKNQQRNKEGQIKIQKIIYWKSISKYRASQIKLWHQSSQKQKYIQKQKQKRDQIIKDFLWKPDIQEIQEIPLFYTTLIQRSEDIPTDYGQRNVSLWERMILLRDQVKFYGKLNSMLKLKPVLENIECNFDGNKIEKLNRASSFCQIFSMTEFSTLSMQSKAKFQKYTQYLKYLVLEYFSSKEYAANLVRNKFLISSQIIKDNPSIYFPMMIGRKEEEKDGQIQGRVQVQVEDYKKIQNIQRMKRQEQEEYVLKKKEKQKQKEQYFKISKQKLKQKQKLQQNSVMPNYVIHRINNMKDIDRFKDQKVSSRMHIEPKNKISNYRRQQFFKKPISIFRQAPSKNLQKIQNKPLSLTKNDSSNNFYYTKSDNKNVRENKFSMINNKNVYNMLYMNEKPLELIEQMEMDFPNKGKIGNIRYKKIVNIEETQKQMSKNLQDIQSIQLNIMSKSSKYISSSSKTKSQSQSQSQYKHQSKHLSQSKAQSSSQPQSETSQNFSSVQEFQYYGKSKPIQKKDYETIKVQFPIRLDNLIIQQNQAFLQYQLYKINLNNFQKILKLDKQKYQCMNVRIWLSQNHISMKENEKLNQISLIVKRLSMDLYFADIQKTYRQESAMSLQDIFKLQGAAMFSKMTLFQVAWKINDEQSIS